MSKIPCKQCTKCGFFHDFSILNCSNCGADLSRVQAKIIDTNSIAKEVSGKIDENVSVYVQKCKRCGASSYITDKENRVQICYNCNTREIALVEPKEYVEVSNENIVTSHSNNDTNNLQQNALDTPVISKWKNISGNISDTLDQCSKTSKQSDVEMNSNNNLEVDWSNELKNIVNNRDELIEESTQPIITLTETRHGKISFSIKPNEQYLLGRSAEQSELLRNDIRIGNEHCYIYFSNGFWYVKDNNSQNGTEVNSKQIGKNGKCILNDGDELKLGHHDDSISFKVSIS